VKKQVSSEKHARIVAAREMSSAGLSYRAIGPRLSPPVNAQRVGQLLKTGVALGLIEAVSRDEATRPVSESDVRAALYEGRSLYRASQLVRMPLPEFKTRFAPVLEAVAQERRATRNALTRALIVSEYLTLAEKLWHVPNSTELKDTSILRRICKHFDSFEEFWRVAGVRPTYWKRSFRERELDRASRSADHGTS